jgi:CTP:molybdopterin cytidylyltransferase MocA
VSAAAVLLAAGGGSRFAASGGAGHKLLASYRGRAVVEHAIVHAADALELVYVVWGAIELPVPSTTAHVQLVENQRWRNGIATSIQAGITRAREDGHDAVVVGLGDQPLITPAAWRAVGAATDHPVAVATYDGVRGNPVRIAAPAWPLLPCAGDAGARVLMRARPDLVVEVPCDGSALDIDTIDDLRQPSGSKDVA